MRTPVRLPDAKTDPVGHSEAVAAHTVTRAVGLRLTDEEIRKLHAPIPGLTSSLNGPCHCPVCDPELHRA